MIDRTTIVAIVHPWELIQNSSTMITYTNVSRQPCVPALTCKRTFQVCSLYISVRGATRTRGVQLPDLNRPLRVGLGLWAWQVPCPASPPIAIGSIKQSDVGFQDKSSNTTTTTTSCPTGSRTSLDVLTRGRTFSCVVSMFAMPTASPSSGT